MRALLLALLISTPALAEPFTPEESYTVGKAVGFFNGCTAVLAAIAEPKHSAEAVESLVKRVFDTCLKQALEPIKLETELLQRPETIALLGDAVRSRTAWFKDKVLLK